MASKEIPAIKIELNDPSTGVTTNGISRITASVLNPFLQDILSSSKIITVADHAALQSLVDSGSLIPGHFYKFTYHTVFKQYGTNTIITGSAETLIIQATDVNTFATKAHSIEHPLDVILYDFTNVLCEDFSTPRPGFIIKRHDTVNNNYYPGDFRAITFARYPINVADQTAWLTSHVYLPGQIIKAPDGKMYRCRKNHTSGVFATDRDTNIYWELIQDIQGQAYLPYATVPKFLGNNGSLHSTGTPTSFPVFAVGTHDCRVEGTYQGWMPNITIRANSSNNIQIGAGCDGIDLGVDPCEDIRIGDNCANIYLANVVTVDIGSNSLGVVVHGGSNATRLGNNTMGAYVNLNSIQNDVADQSQYLYLYNGANYNRIGNNAVVIHIDGVASEAVGNRIGEDCDHIFLNGCNHNVLEGANYNITLYYAEFSSIGLQTHDMSNSKDNSGLGNFINCTFGPSCNNIRLNGASAQMTHTTFGANVGSVTVANSGVLDTLKIGDGVSGITLGVGAYLGGGSIGNWSYNITVNASADLDTFTMGASCSNITLNGAAKVTQSTFGEAVQGVTFEIGSRATNVYIGNQSNTIDISGQIFNSTFGTNCNGITFGANADISDCIFGDDCTSLNFGASLTMKATRFGAYTLSFTTEASTTIYNTTIGEGCQYITLKTGKSFNKVNLFNGLAHHTFNCNLSNINFAISNNGFTTTFTTDLSNKCITAFNTSTYVYYYYNANTSAFTAVPL